MDPHKAWTTDGKQLRVDFSFYGEKKNAPAGQVPNGKATLLQKFKWCSLHSMGETHEKVAIAALSKERNLLVEKTGVWLDHCGFLGASPDGLAGTDTVVEVKCPYSVRFIDPKTSLSDPANFKKWCLFFFDGTWRVDINHEYYHQIKAQMYFTNRERAYSGMGTTKGFKSVVIRKDPNWERNVDILKEFYLKYFIPYVHSMHACAG